MDRQIVFVEQQIMAEQNAVVCPLKPKTSRLKWTCTTLDYVEWVYGLYAVLNRNGEKATLKTIFDVFNPVFGFEDFQFSSYFGKIRSRKRIERTTFIDLQKQLFTERMEETDNKQRK